MSSGVSMQSQDMHLREEEFQALSREDREYYLNLLQKEIAYRKARKLLYYIPLPKQKLFHSSPCITRAIFGGNRSGKTTAGGIEFLFHLTGLYPKWYPEENKVSQPVIGRIIARDFQKGVGEVVVPFLEEWLDSSIVKKKYRNPIGVPVKWTLKNGSVFDILTHEQSTEQFEGWRGHIAWFDEPPPRDKYVATLRGLVDYHGKNWLTLTPLNQPWIYDEIFVNPEKSRIFVVITDIRDNTYLSEEAITEFEKSLTEEEKEARLHGRFMHLTGLVYKEFDPDIHICEPFRLKPHWTRYFAIDPHERENTACLWIAVDEQDNHWVYDELWISGNIKHIADSIHAQEGDYPAQIRLIDPHMDKENTILGGLNIRSELASEGIYCQRAHTDPLLGKSRVRMALKPKYVHLSGTSKPQLRVFRTCKRTIYEFQHYIYSDRRNKEEFNLNEKPKKANDHFMDCMRYIYNYNPRFIHRDPDEEATLRYEGEYTKYPVKEESGLSKAYRDLVEER